MPPFKIIFSDEVKQLATIFQKQNFEIYAVGGFIRDSIIARTHDSIVASSDDIDFATNAPPQTVMKLFKHTIPTGLRHGTVTVVFHGISYEITTYRIDEKYTDYRRPETVLFSSSLEDDLARRDFTINALAAHPIENNLIDIFSGIEDIQKKIIRCVGNPAVRFDEDALRILRAIRFATVLGFEIEKETYDSICSLHSNIQHISKERIQTELRKILCSSSPARGMKLLYNTGLLPYVISSHIDTALHIIQRLSSIASPQCINVGSDEEIIRLALCFSLTRESVASTASPYIYLCHAHSLQLSNILRTLKFSNKTIQYIQFLVSRTHYIRQKNNVYYVYISEFQLSVLVSKYGIEKCQLLIQYLRTILSYYQYIQDYIQTEKCTRSAEKQLTHLSGLLCDSVFLSKSIPKQSLSIKGNHIANILDKKEGKWLGTLMATLHRYVLKHPEKNNENDLLMVAKKIFQNSYRQT